jgi:hypothetical protein
MKSLSLTYLKAEIHITIITGYLYHYLMGRR